MIVSKIGVHAKNWSCIFIKVQSIDFKLHAYALHNWLIWQERKCYFGGYSFNDSLKTVHDWTNKWIWPMHAFTQESIIKWNWVFSCFECESAEHWPFFFFFLQNKWSVLAYLLDRTCWGKYFLNQSVEIKTFAICWNQKFCNISANFNKRWIERRIWLNEKLWII